MAQVPWPFRVPYTLSVREVMVTGSKLVLVTTTVKVNRAARARAG